MTDLLVLAIGLVLGCACTVGYFALGRHAERLAKLEESAEARSIDAFNSSKEIDKLTDALTRLDKDAGSFAERLNLRRND